MWSPAGSAALPGTESCVLASEVARPSLDAEELQRLRISCPAEVGTLRIRDPRPADVHRMPCMCAETCVYAFAFALICACLSSPPLSFCGGRLDIDPSLLPLPLKDACIGERKDG